MKTSTSIMLPGNLTRVFMLLAGLFTLPFQTSARFYPAPLATPITLPIEVIGPDGYTEKVSFDLENAAGINQLYLKIHRPVYRDVLVNSGRGAKASIRLNGGAWIDLTNSTAEAFPHEKQYGENHQLGKYFSNAWYQLQLALNAGNKSGYNLGPVDWNYQPDHIINLKSEGGG